MTVANAIVAPQHAKLVGAELSYVEVDEGFDRAWRRVGLALDRVGFTVEDRDRVQGVYFVRYVDPELAAKDGFFSKLFSFGARRQGQGSAALPRVVKADAGRHRQPGHGADQRRQGRTPRRPAPRSSSCWATS
jgi:outer membrane protein assembly factor BamC